MFLRTFLWLSGFWNLYVTHQLTSTCLPWPVSSQWRSIETISGANITCKTIIKTITTTLTLNLNHIFFCLFSHLQWLLSLCVHSFVIVIILSSPPVSGQTRSWRLRQDHLLCNSRSQSRRWSPGAHWKVKMMWNLLSSKDNYICQVDGGRGEGIRSIPELAIVPEVLWVISASNWAELVIKHWPTFQKWITSHQVTCFTHFIHFAISIEQQKE